MPRSRGLARQYAARLGLWALFLQILLPLGQGIPLPSSADGLPRQLVICSANGGLRTVPLPGADTAAKHSSSAQSACAVCLSYAAGGHLTLPSAAPQALPWLHALSTIDQTSVSIAGHSLLGLPQARAPPAQTLFSV
jgi:hypothetical protein